MDDDEPREPELTPDGDVFGAPRKFTYPAPPSFTEEERQRYAEAVNTITNSSSSSVVS
jgi:hypothetical protein